MCIRDRGDPVGGAGTAEDIGDLERGAHGLQPSGPACVPVNIASLSSGLMTARTVRVATRV